MWLLTVTWWSRLLLLLAMMFFASRTLNGARLEIPGDTEVVTCGVVQIVRGVDTSKTVSMIQQSISVILGIPDPSVRSLLPDDTVDASGSRYYYFQVKRMAGDQKLKELLAVIQNLVGVEAVIAEPRPFPAQASATPSFLNRQAYLNADAMGVLPAWSDYPGLYSRGYSVTIEDLELGWIPFRDNPPRAGHEDLPGPRRLITDQSADFGDQQHGTAVVGILGAVDNGFGITGIANRAEIEFEPVANKCLSVAVVEAAMSRRAGDILLIEVQMPPIAGSPLPSCCIKPQCGFVPVEYWEEVRKVIKWATQTRGLTVVEVAGNGSVNLDGITDSTGSKPFVPRDSGAILVGAGKAYGGAPMCFTNWGKQAVNLEAWGEKVATTGFGLMFHPNGDVSRYYTDSFSGTSSAAAIVGGMVADVQATARSKCGRNFTAGEILALLYNTGSLVVKGNKLVGNRPNLDKALKGMAC